MKIYEIENRTKNIAGTKIFRFLLNKIYKFCNEFFSSCQCILIISNINKHN